MNIIVAGALLGVAGVILGAWGAHGLAESLTAAQLSSWSTAVQYQQVHVLAVLVCAVWQRLSPRPIRFLPSAVYAWLGGTILFSGSIYALTLGGPSWLGPITPLGGLLMIMGWGLLIAAGLTQRDD